MKSLSGKGAFVTGAASGIGAAIARELAQRGVSVMLADIDAEKLSETVDAMRTNGLEAHAVVCDVADLTSVQKAASETNEHLGKIHILVNNAGVAVGGSTGSIPVDDWKWVVDINLMGVVHGIETFVPLIRAHGEGGHIVNTASVAGHIALPGTAPYSASKFAVVGYSEGLRHELARENIGVSMLCPGWVNTKIHESNRNRPSKAMRPSGGASKKVTEQMAEFAALIESGMDPALVAQLVAEGILDNRRHIFTHSSMRAGVDERLAAITADYDACDSDPRRSGY